MQQYKRILLAFDFIKYDDDSVLSRALNVAKQVGAELFIVHAIEYPTPVVAPMPGLFEKLERSSRDHLKRLGESVGVSQERQILVVGPAKSAIIEVAKSIGADLIVVGSHGRYGITAWLLGNTAQSVVQNAPCDVLVVRLKRIAETVQELPLPFKESDPLPAD